MGADVEVRPLLFKMISEYIEPETMVKTKVGGIKAMIVEIRINLSNVPRYLLSYFSGGIQQEILMYEKEFDLIDNDKQDAG